jgi:hypothetical protein
MLQNPYKAKGLSNRTALYSATPMLKATYGDGLAYGTGDQQSQLGLRNSRPRSQQRRSRTKSNLGQTRFPYSLLPSLPNLAHTRQDVNHA